jgi:hypothetical protein
VDVCDYILSCLTLNGATCQGPGSRAPTRYWKKLQAWLLRARACAEPGLRVRQTGLIGGKILPTHDSRDGGKDRCRLLLGPVLLRLVVPPLQL